MSPCRTSMRRCSVSTRAELIRQHRRLGTTMIYVTHDQVEAMTMGSRICIMNEGRIAQTGRPMEVYRDPADTFVARFLGSPGMNLVPVEADGGALRLGDATLPGPDRRGPVILGVRPEDLYEPGSVPQGTETATLAAEVDTVEPLGAETLLTFTLPGREGALTARVGREARARPGERVPLHVDLAALRFFDAETQRALPRNGATA